MPWVARLPCQLAHRCHTRTLPPRPPRRVYLVPPSACGFVGLGYVGCDGSYTCRAWIGSAVWDSATAIAHELGHNLFMGHATSILPDLSVDE